MIPKVITPLEAQVLIASGALLVDIRDADEHARERIPNATNLPLSRIGELSCEGRPVIFHCRSGMRTSDNADVLSASAGAVPCHLVEGGIDAWRASGLSTVTDGTKPIEIARQVQLAAGGLVLLGALLGFLVAPAFVLLSAFVGAGLVFSGAIGWCGMAQLMRRMPWNRRALV